MIFSLYSPLIEPGIYLREVFIFLYYVHVYMQSLRLCARTRKHKHEGVSERLSCVKTSCLYICLDSCYWWRVESGTEELNKHDNMPCGKKEWWNCWICFKPTSNFLTATSLPFLTVNSTALNFKATSKELCCTLPAMIVSSRRPHGN